MKPNNAGPIYNIDSAALKKFRARKALSREYGAAVEAAVLSAQRAALMRAGNPTRRSPCASGTWHTTGEEIDKAMRDQHRASLLAYPSKVRRERKPDQWQKLYNEAMHLKRNGASKTMKTKSELKKMTALGLAKLANEELLLEDELCWRALGEPLPKAVLIRNILSEQTKFDMR